MGSSHKVQLYRTSTLEIMQTSTYGRLNKEIVVGI